MSSAKPIRWGILATGGIAITFTKDLLVDPTTRGVTNIKHEVVAAASSSSASRAQDFLKEVGAPSSAKAYGSYAELVADPNVDIIYIATPHSHHFQNAMLCLDAGKHVLCEKAFTANASQSKILVQKARDKNLFLMEAVWTRYFPLSIYVREQIRSGRIGTVQRVFADLSNANDPDTTYADGKHRMVNPKLAGGTLLDLGIYSLTWCFQTLYSTQTGNKARPKVVSVTKKFEPTGVDEMNTIVLVFPRPADKGGDAHAIATSSLRIATHISDANEAPAIRIQGEKGEIQVFPPAFRPVRTRLLLSDGSKEDRTWKQPGPGPGSGWTNGFGGDENDEGEGHGMFWEADEAASALLEGRKEGKYLDLEESVLIMEVMDEIRKKADVVYPKEVESTEYPIEM